MGDEEVRAINGVSLNIEPGEFVAIMGPSGSGKSTLMHVLGLLDTPDSGSYKLMGQEVSGLKEDELAALRSEALGFVFQQYNLLARTPADENVALPLLYRSSGAIPNLAVELLEKVGLGNRTKHKPNELSGGQQQRVAIARALVNKPSIIFADEPTGNLDSTSTKEIMDLLVELNRSGITLVLVTHESDIAAQADRIITMHDGVVATDTKKQTRSVKQVSAKRPAIRAETAKGWMEKIKHVLNSVRIYFREALRALAANKVRAALSMLGILIGVMAVISMLAVGAGAKKTMEERLSSLGSNRLILGPAKKSEGAVKMAAGDVTRLTLDDAEALARAKPLLRSVSPQVRGWARFIYKNKNANSQLLGTGVEYAQMGKSQPEWGRFFTEEEIKARARVVVLGMTVVKELFGEGSPLGETVRINSGAFQVIGVLPEKGSSGWRDQDDLAVIPVNTAMFRVMGKKYLDSITIEARSGKDMALAEETVKNIMRRREGIKPGEPDTFKIYNMVEIQKMASKSTEMFSLLLAAIGGISLLVGGIGIMNIMLVSVTERTREIGLRKALGARRIDIMAQFLIEAIVISMVGGILGLGAGIGISALISTLASDWSTVVTLDSVLTALMFSGAVGIVFGIWPARKASLLDPIEALRYE